MKKYIKKIFIITLILIISVITVSYAIYRTTVELNFKTTTGELEADISVDYNDTYKVNGIPYFFVTVTNKETDVTDVNMNYTLTIKDNTSGNGIFAIAEVQADSSVTQLTDYLSTATTSRNIHNRRSYKNI